MKSFNEIYGKIYKYCETHQIEIARRNENRGKILNIAIIVAVGIIFALVLSKIVDLDSEDSFSANILLMIFYLAIAGIISFLNFWKKFKAGPKNPFEKESFSTQYKKKIVSKLVEFYDPNLKFDIDGKFPIFTYQVRSFGPYHRLVSSDCIAGKIDGKLPINIADIVVIKDNTEEYQKTTEVLNVLSVASGNFGSISKAPEKVEEIVFSGLYAAIPIRMPRAQLIKLLPQHASYIKSEICEKVTLDSLELEKNFECFSTDKMYTMSIFTSEVIECINNYKKKIPEPIDIVIGGNYLSIRIAAKDVFEGVESKEVLDYEVLYKYFLYLDFICELSKLITVNTERYAENNNIKKVSQPIEKDISFS